MKDKIAESLLSKELRENEIEKVKTLKEISETLNNILIELRELKDSVKNLENLRVTGRRAL